jgi:hypothetical protein
MFPPQSKQNKGKETLHRRQATSALALHPSLPSTSLRTGPIFAGHLRATHAPSLLTSLPYSGLLSQPPHHPCLPLSPSCCRCSESEIAIPQHNLDVNASALDNFCPSLLSRGGIRSGLVGVLAPPTILRCWGIVHGCRRPFVIGLLIPPLLLRGLPLHSLPSVLLCWGSGGGGIR